MAPRQLPWVIPEYCEGCSACIGACPRALLYLHEHSEGHFVPWLDDPSQCSGCGRCADACGLGGIAMTEYIAEAAARLENRSAGRRRSAQAADGNTLPIGAVAGLKA